MYQSRCGILKLRTHSCIIFQISFCRSSKYERIRDDSFRTFASDPHFLEAVPEASIVRLLNSFQHYHSTTWHLRQNSINMIFILLPVSPFDSFPSFRISMYALQATMHRSTIGKEWFVCVMSLPRMFIPCQCFQRHLSSLLRAECFGWYTAVQFPRARRLLCDGSTNHALLSTLLAADTRWRHGRMQGATSSDAPFTPLSWHTRVTASATQFIAALKFNSKSCCTDGRSPVGRRDAANFRPRAVAAPRQVPT